MKAIVRALYNDPVIAAGVLQTGAVGLAASEAVPWWVALVVVPVTAFIARNFTRPDQPA